MNNESMFYRNGKLVEVNYTLKPFDPAMCGQPAEVFVSIDGGEPVHFPHHIVLRHTAGADMWKDCGSGVMYSTLAYLVDNELSNLAYYL